MFSILASMACNIFIIMVLTVASKSYFSAPDKFLTDKRMRSNEKIFEVLVLLKVWYNTESRLQDKLWMHSIDRE
jgi:hAT family C-terminal dimerisation region